MKAADDVEKRIALWRLCVLKRSKVCREGNAIPKRFRAGGLAAGFIALTMRIAEVRVPAQSERGQHADDDDGELPEGLLVGD